MENLQRTDAALRSTVALVALLNLGYFGVEFAVALANVAIIAAGIVTAATLSAWPDLIVGLGIFGSNLDACGRSIRLRAMSAARHLPSPSDSFVGAETGGAFAGTTSAECSSFLTQS